MTTFLIVYGVVLAVVLVTVIPELLDGEQEGDEPVILGAIVLWPLTLAFLGVYCVVAAVVAALRMIWKAGR